MPWITEYLTPHEKHSHHVRKYLVKKKTAFQNAVVADTHSFGRCLILDGEIQSAQSDEFIYHESLVHPAAVLHPGPREVLILGGGEGATVRETLKHKTVRRVTMVDIDGEVVDFCLRYLKPWHRGALSNPRTRLLIEDARNFVETTTEKFDIILSDLPTPDKAGPANLLYTAGFYRILKKRLSPGGLFALQAGSGHPLQIKLHHQLAATARKVFKNVFPYYAYVPSFGVPWAFLLCSDAGDPKMISAPEVNRRLSRRTGGAFKFYDGETHIGLFHVPKHLRRITFL